MNLTFDSNPIQSLNYTIEIYKAEMFIFNVISKTLLLQMMKILHILLCHNLLLIKRKKRTGSKLVTIGYKNLNPSKISIKINGMSLILNVVEIYITHKASPPLLFSIRTIFSPLVSMILMVQGFTGRAGLDVIILK